MAAVVASTQLLSARFAVSDARPLVARRAATAPTVAVPRSLTVTAGWFDNNKDVGGRDAMWEKQQEILRKRKGGNNVETEVQARRKKVSGFMKGTLGEALYLYYKITSSSTRGALSVVLFRAAIPLPRSTSCDKHTTIHIMRAFVQQCFFFFSFVTSLVFFRNWRAIQNDFEGKARLPFYTERAHPDYQARRRRRPSRR